MIEITIPGFRQLRLEHLLLDYNGTIAEDGRITGGVGDLIRRLASDLTVHVLTADTFGGAASRLERLPCSCIFIPRENQEEAKRRHVTMLGKDTVCAIGNGRNDRLMLREAALGIAVIRKEGAAVDAVTAADVVCTDILDALGLLLNPLRLTATLRS